jgi:hypothetical protein
MPEKGQKTPAVKRSKRKTRSPEQLHDLDLAGGEEGGMPAGSAGGPGEKDVRRERKVSDQG